MEHTPGGRIPSATCHELVPGRLSLSPLARVYSTVQRTLLFVQQIVAQRTENATVNEREIWTDEYSSFAIHAEDTEKMRLNPRLCVSVVLNIKSDAPDAVTLDRYQPYVLLERL